MIDSVTCLAQTSTTQSTQPPPGQTSQPPPGLSSMLPMFLIMGLIFYFLLIRPQSREKKKRAQMIDALKKNDRVLTIGGIVGTITAVRDDEITLKVDESSNTKITFSRASIQRVMGNNGGNPPSGAK
ncbi:MAG: preprotein translocase subunit YajC [Phycisphaerae bacterium]